MSAGEGRITLESARDPGTSRTNTSNILFLAPALHEGSRRACFDMLSGGHAGESNIIAVNYTTSPSTWLGEYERHVGEPPARASLVNVQDNISNGAPSEASPEWLSSRSVEPGNITDLGVNLGDVIGQYSSLATGESGGIRLCFHSLSVLLFYTEIDQACQFLHRVTRAVETHGITAHYHLDPVAFDDQEIAKFRTLCDEVVGVANDELADEHGSGG